VPKAFVSRKALGVNPGTVNESESALFDLHPFPKCHKACNFLRRVFRGRVVPSGILVHLSVHFKIIVACDPFPWAGRVSRTFLEILSVKSLGREINIPFNFFELIGFSQNSAVPDCFQFCSSEPYKSTWVIQLYTTGRNVPPAASHASAVVMEPFNPNCACFWNISFHCAFGGKHKLV